MPMLPFLLLAVTATAPHPGKIETFGKWEVACDNLRRCEMTALHPDTGPGKAVDEDAPAEQADCSIVREPGPTGGFTVDVSASQQRGRNAHIVIDGTTFGGGVTERDDLTLRGDAARRIVAAMATGEHMTLLGGGNAKPSHVSLDGSAAALRFIDAEQGRAGTVTAVMAKGERLASTVPPAAVLPHITAVRAGGVAAPVTPALIRTIRALSKNEACDISINEPITGVAIGGGATLVLLPCEAGAYNVITIPFVVVAGKPALAIFDWPAENDNSDSGDSVPGLSNAGWDPETATLFSQTKGRGFGDCGDSESYVWDGRSFRLVDQERMDICANQVNWLTVWRAVVDRR
ncbi:DUF1176 domain-containing protein [Sphingomonas sp. RT2P30]